MSAGDVRMDVGRADRAAHPRQGENAEQDQHDADGEFHRQTEPWRDHDPEHDDRRADRHDRQGVPDAPGGADQRRARHAALATDDRRNGDHMVGVGRMPHPEEEAEQQEGQDVQADSGHHARAKRVIPGHTMQRFDPPPTPICACPLSIAGLRDRSAASPFGGTMFACAGPNRPSGAPIERSHTIYLEIRSRTGSFDSRGPRDLREHFPGGSGQRAARPQAVIGCICLLGWELMPTASQAQTQKFQSTGLLAAAGRRPAVRMAGSVPRS